MNLKPLHDRIIVEPLETEGKTAGGIIIPEQSKARGTTSVVIAVGPGKSKEEPNTLVPGQIVMHGQFAGAANEVHQDGKKYLIMRESDVFCVEEE